MTRLLLAAAALVAVLAAAGVVRVSVGYVVPGAGTPIQTAIDAAGAGDTIHVHAGTNARECGCGDGAGVRTADTKMFM